MTIGAGIFLAAVGAILTFAVNATVAGINIHAVGVILMLAGVVGIALELAVFAPRRRTVRTTGYAPAARSYTPATTPVAVPVATQVATPVATPVAVPVDRVAAQPAQVVTETRY